MGQITLEDFAGGAILLTPGANTTIRWWHDRRVQTIRPTLGGLTMTMDSATSTVALPWGPAVLVVCPQGATGFTLAAAGWSIPLTAGKAVLVHRVKSGGSSQFPTPIWLPQLFNVPT